MNKALQQYGLVFRSPLRSNGGITFRCHAAKIQNAGTTIITVSGAWTIFPGGHLDVSNHSNNNILVDSIPIEFGEVSVVSGEPAKNSCQVMEYQLHDAHQAHYDG